MNTIYETKQATLKASEDGKLYVLNHISDGFLFVGYHANGVTPGPSTSILLIA